MMSSADSLQLWLQGAGVPKALRSRCRAARRPQRWEAPLHLKRKGGVSVWLCSAS